MKAEIAPVNDVVTDLTFSVNATDQLSMWHQSDLHLDSPLCDRKTLTKHLRQAEETQSPVLIAGDVFDSMQSHDDPRRRPEELKAEYHVSHYLDAIVQDAVRFFRQFNLQYIFGMGNHESVILKKLNTGLIDRLTYGVNVEGGDALAVGYAGYLRLNFRYKRGNTAFQKVVYFHHGRSTNAEVTRGAIQTNRQAVYMHEADLVQNGHNHQGWIMNVPRSRLSAAGEPYNDLLWFIRTPGYKLSGIATQERFGYGAERHPAPTPIGCVRVDYEFSKHTGVDINPVPIMI